MPSWSSCDQPRPPELTSQAIVSDHWNHGADQVRFAAVTEIQTLVPGKGERTRQRLLDIAVRRFAADGFRRTSVSDIAREAGERGGSAREQLFLFVAELWERVEEYP